MFADFIFFGMDQLVSESAPFQAYGADDERRT
jgi:hypothetical protein